MTEEQLRATMLALYSEKLPNDATLSDWVVATGFAKDKVKQIYSDAINDPDPWGLPVGLKDDGS